MAGNDKKFVVKNGLTTQNILFTNDINNHTDAITASMSSNTIVFEGRIGHLFSIDDTQSDVVFSVNDFSGAPSIVVGDYGTVRITETSGNLLVGKSIDNGVDKLQVEGSLYASKVGFDVLSSNTNIEATTANNDTLTFSGNVGPLFSIIDNQAETIFAVNDISGVPSIVVGDYGTIRFAETFGNVLIGTATDNGSKLQVNGTVTAIDFNSTSDLTKKTDLVKIDNAIDKVNKINGYTFTFKETGQKSAGVIAQELREVLPVAVRGEEGNMTVSYDSIIGLLIEAIKEQQTQIDQLISKTV